MATKKNKLTVKPTVDTVDNTEPKGETTVDTVTYSNSPATNAIPLSVNRVLQSPPEVIRVPVKLEDVQHQVGMFRDLPRGRYVMEYSDNGTTNVLSVYWDGVDTVEA